MKRLGTTRSGKVYLAAAFLLLTGSLFGFAAHAKHKDTAAVIYGTGDGIPDANQVGNIDAAMTQTQQLFTALQAVNFDPLQLPDFKLAMLPDAQFAEDESLRDPNSTSYTFPDMPEQSQIACYTDVYVRQNRSYYQGDQSTAAPSGFFIVAWKSGLIEKVPVGAVRRLTRADGGGIDCFPGMTGYDPSLPGWMQ